jgi:hypothetical protein
MIGEGDCGEIGGMKIGRGKLSTRRKPAPAPCFNTCCTRYNGRLGDTNTLLLSINSNYHIGFVVLTVVNVKRFFCWFLFCFTLNPENGGCVFLRNVRLAPNTLSISHETALF